MSEKDGEDSSQDELFRNQSVQEQLQSLDRDKADAASDLPQNLEVESDEKTLNLLAPEAAGGEATPEGAVGAEATPEGAVGAEATPEGAVGGDANVEGAVGVEDEISPFPTKDTEHYVDINQQASTLDKKGLCSGKLVVFRKYFDREDLLFCTRPDTRRRHTAQRQRHCSEGNRPNSDQTSSNGMPVGYVPVDSGVEPLLNQAGAIIGISGQPSEFANIRGDGIILPGFGRMKNPKHSIGSAETVPIGEIYSGNFSPPRPSSASSRGVSPGSSFPSFSSRPQTASDSYNLKISPLPDSVSVAEARQSSPSSMDSEILHDGSVRQRRFGVSQPIPVPLLSKLCHSTSASYPDESDLANLPRRKISKDSSEFSERISSEDDGINFPELSQSVESDHGLPIPDLNKAALENLEQNLYSFSLNVPSEVSSQGHVVHNIVQETEESESEHEVTVMSCSPDGTKDLDYPPPDD